MKLLKRQFNVLDTKVSTLDKKIPDPHIFTYINQNNTNKQNLEKKNGGDNKKIPGVSGLVAIAILNTKLRGVENNTPAFSY